MEKRTEKSDITPISKEWQALRLQELVVFLKTQKGDQWRKAEQEGKLSEFIRQYLWLWGIHVAYWEQYQFSPWEFQFECTYERSVHTVSTALNGLYRDRYRRELIPGQKDYGVVTTMLALRSPLRVTRPLKELQLQCLGGAALCMGLSAASLVRGRIGSASLLAASAIDLQTISFNCYEKRYGDLYLQQLSGDVNALCDTAYAFTKSMLGITPLTTNPLLRLSGKINWDILLTDTIAEYAFRQVLRILRCHTFLPKVLLLTFRFLSRLPSDETES